MGQFKPMVKMMTTEPSVILKLKKGGKVASKMDGGYMPMQSTMPAQAMPATPARGGLAPAASPMAPSMAARRKAMTAKPAMNASLLMKKGGKAMKHEDAAEDRAMIKKAMAGKKFATGGVVNGQGGFKDGGIIKSTKGETKMVTAKVDHSPAKTGGVKLGNGGGYADGGTIKGGNWENRPADTAKPGKTGGTTGGVRKGNAGGFKMGGTAKKAYAMGGTVDTGKPVAMPKKPASKPVANSMQSGTFAKGGKVGKYADGDLVDASKGAYEKAIGPSEEDMDMAKAIRSVPRKLYEGAKGMLGLGTTKPAGSVTKTEKSVTVAPARKKMGGGC
jgi:hypothetical protein